MKKAALLLALFGALQVRCGNAEQLQPLCRDYCFFAEGQCQTHQIERCFETLDDYSEKQCGDLLFQAYNVDCKNLPWD